MISVRELAEKHGYRLNTFKHLLWRMNRRLPENHRVIRTRGKVDEGSFRAAYRDYEKLTRQAGRRRDGAGGRYLPMDGGGV